MKWKFWRKSKYKCKYCNKQLSFGKHICQECYTDERRLKHLKDCNIHACKSLKCKLMTCVERK